MNFSLEFCCIILYYIERFCVLIERYGKERRKEGKKMEIMRVKEVAKYLQIGDNTIYKFAHSGPILFLKNLYSVENTIKVSSK
jgi:hypothetical protein